MRNTINTTAKTLLLIAFFQVLSTSAHAQQMPGLPPNQLVLAAGDHEINFKWLGDSVNATWEPYAYFLVPVKLPGCPKLFFMQFDTGSPISLFYQSKLKSIRSKYPKAVPMSDSATLLRSFSFKVGDVAVLAKEVGVRQKINTGINWTDRKSIEIIGTIGTDFIENKVVVIDYPHQKLLIQSEVPRKLRAQLKLTDFVFAGRSVLLPAIIKGKKTMLFFDTGSSAYELLTDKKTFQSFSTRDSVPVTHKAQSWDRVLTANTISVQDSLEINNQKLPILHATYMEGAAASQVAQMMKLGIGGMTGNKLFINYTLVLDTKAKKFGVVGSR